MQYLVKTVVAHMRNIEIGEMELMALFGMFIWNDCAFPCHLFFEPFIL